MLTIKKTDNYYQRKTGKNIKKKEQLEEFQIQKTPETAIA